MFVIVTYDVNAKRDPKVMKTLRKYLTLHMNSVQYLRGLSHQDD